MSRSPGEKVTPRNCGAGLVKLDVGSLSDTGIWPWIKPRRQNTARTTPGPTTTRPRRLAAFRPSRVCSKIGLRSNLAIDEDGGDEPAGKCGRVDILGHGTSLLASRRLAMICTSAQLAVFIQNCASILPEIRQTPVGRSSWLLGTLRTFQPAGRRNIIFNMRIM